MVSSSTPTRLSPSYALTDERSLHASPERFGELKGPLRCARGNGFWNGTGRSDPNKLLGERRHARHPSQLQRTWGVRRRAGNQLGEEVFIGGVVASPAAGGSPGMGASAGSSGVRPLPAGDSQL